jgi:hypothetical protein
MNTNKALLNSDVLGFYEYGVEGSILYFTRVESAGGFMTSVCIDLETLIKELELKGIRYGLIKPEWLNEDGNDFVAEIVIEGVKFNVMYTNFKEAGERGFVKVECGVFNPYEGSAMDGGRNCLSNYALQYKENPVLSKFASYIITKYVTNYFHQKCVNLSGLA